jgi:hypothetical protein
LATFGTRDTPIFPPVSENWAIRTSGGVSAGRVDAKARRAESTSGAPASITAEARKFKNEGYDYGLLFADAVGYSIIGRMLDGLTRDQFDAWLTRIAEDPRRQICSSLAAAVLQDQPGLANTGALAQPAREISPQGLFRDETVFAPVVFEFKGGHAVVPPSYRLGYT